MMSSPGLQSAVIVALVAMLDVRLCVCGLSFCCVIVISRWAVDSEVITYAIIFLLRSSMINDRIFSPYALHMSKCNSALTSLIPPCGPQCVATLVAVGGSGRRSTL